MTEYPEHEKLSNIKHFTQEIHDFLEFSRSEGISLCDSYEDDLENVYFMPIYTSEEDDLIAKFYDIDLYTLAIEKDQMLDEIRGANEV